MQKTCDVCGCNMYLDSTYPLMSGEKLVVYICCGCHTIYREYINTN